MDEARPKVTSEQYRELLEKLPPETIDSIAGPMLDILEKQREKELARCKRDMWHFVSTWCRTVHYHFEEAAFLGPDAEISQTVEKFPDFPHVKRTITALEKPRNTLIEKSRDMMATWMVCAVFLHDVMFQRGAQLLMATRVSDDVDDGGDQSTPQSLMGRIRFMYTNLPPWMQEQHRLSFKMKQIQNKDADNVIVGTKAKKDTGRQGKYRRSLADEFGFWDYGESNLAALRFGCQNGLILLSTPPELGKQQVFGRLASTGAPGFNVITLHWSEHPMRKGDMGKAWYQAVTGSMTATQIARELEIDYEGAIEGRIFPSFTREVNVLEHIPYEPKVPLHLTFDHGLNEETCIFVQRRGECPECGEPLTFFIDSFQGGYAHAQRKQTVWENRDHIIDEILCKPPYNFKLDDLDAVVGLGFCTGDPAGKSDDVQINARKTDDTKLTSYHRVYASRGIRIRSKFSKWRDGVTLMRNAMKSTCGQPHMFVSEERCKNLWDALTQAQYRRDPSSDPHRPRFLDEPKKDWTTHWCDSARYYYVNTENIARVNQPKLQGYRQVWKPGSIYPTMVPI